MVEGEVVAPGVADGAGNGAAGDPVHGPGPGHPPGVREQATVWLLVALIGLAFADTSIVALALPQIYGRFDTSIVTVSWVLTGYAVAVTLVAAGATVARRRLRPVSLIAVGLVVLAATCVGAALAPSLPILLASRCGQGVGAALLLVGTVPVLAGMFGDRTGRLVWTKAAALGLAVGPALGGVLAQAFDWRAIFLAQVPLAVVGLTVLRDRRIRTAPGSAGLPSPGTGPVLGLTLLSGSLVGALFLSVLMVIEVWRMTPLGGAGVVSALPVGMLAAQPVVRRLAPVTLTVAGVGTMAGGLAAMALLPAATVPWAMTALLVCGVGWAMLDQVFELAPVEDGALRPDAQGAQGLRAAGISTGARHAGLVIGLVLISPVLAGALEHATERAVLSGTAIVLDAKLPLQDKIKVAVALRDGIADSDRGHVPDVAGIVARSADGSLGATALGDQLSTRLRDTLTRAFRPSFGIAAALAACTLFPGLLTGRRRSGPAPAGMLPGRAQLQVAAALPALAGVLLVAQLSLGATGFGVPAALPDPCRAAPDPYPGKDADAIGQKLALSTVNGAACSLGVSRESLVLSLGGTSRFGTAGLAPEKVEPALRAGLTRAVDDAQKRGDLSGLAAFALRELVGRAPLSWLAEQLHLPQPAKGR